MKYGTNNRAADFLHELATIYKLSKRTKFAPAPMSIHNSPDPGLHDENIES